MTEDDRARLAAAEQQLRSASSAADAARAGFVATMRDILPRWRAELGVTQAALARRMGVDPATTSRIESGHLTQPGLCLQAVDAMWSLERERASADLAVVP